MWNNCQQDGEKGNQTLAIIMGVFLLCWIPYFLCIIFQPLIHEITSISVIEALSCLALSNSMFSPFIYAFFYSWFRSAFRIILSGKIFHSDFSNTKLLWTGKWLFSIMLNDVSVYFCAFCKEYLNWRQPVWLKITSINESSETKSINMLHDNW